MAIDKILLFDGDITEETIFLIEFENDEEREKVENCIYNVKRRLPTEWTFDDILKEIQNNFKVKNIMEVYGFEQMGI